MIQHESALSEASRLLERGRPLRLTITERAPRAPRRSHKVKVAGVANPEPASKLSVARLE